MKIISIKLNNFKIHQQSEFNFSDGVNALLGKNGSGKSSIVDAIGIGLFNANTNLSEFITYGQATAKITILFSFQNKLYTLVREFGKVSSTQLTFDYIEIKGNKEVYNYLSTLFGIDLKQYFNNILRIKSSSITFPFITDTTKRKIIFDDILNINKYYDIYLFLREPIKELETIVITLEKQLHYNKGKLDSKDRFIQEISTLSDDYIKLNKLQETYLKHKDDLALKLKISKEVDKIEFDIIKNEKRLNELQKSREVLIDSYCYICNSPLEPEQRNNLLELNENESVNRYDSIKKLEIIKNDLKQQLMSIKVPNDLKDYSNDLIQTKSKIELYEKELIELNKIDLSKISAKIYTYKAKIDRLNKIRDGFKIIPQLLSEYNTKNISFRASEILSHLMDKDVKVTFDTSYNTIVEFDDKVLDYEQLSDGQQIMLGLSIRLAISNLFSDYGFIILDEPTVNLDDNSRLMLIEKLYSMGFYQMIVISHDNTFENNTDNIVRL